MNCFKMYHFVSGHLRLKEDEVVCVSVSKCHLHIIGKTWLSPLADYKIIKLTGERGAFTNSDVKRRMVQSIGW